MRPRAADAARHRLLKRRGADCQEWLEFDGKAACYGLMGGICNVEEVDLTGRGSQGVAFRSFDIARRTWSNHWVSGDTGLSDQFKEIGAQHGPFDLVMLEVGAFHQAWGTIHLGPENALKVFQMLQLLHLIMLIMNYLVVHLVVFLNQH